MCSKVYIFAKKVHGVERFEQSTKKETRYRCLMFDPIVKRPSIQVYFW